MKQSARYETGLVCILFLTFGTVMLDRFSQLFLGPYLVREMHLTGGEIGMLASAVGICWALSAVVFGAVSDRVGRRKVLVPAILIFSACSWMSALAQNFTQLLVIRALLGLAEGPCWSIIMALLEESSSSGTRGRNVGIVNSAGPLIGAAIGPILVTQIASLVGWRWSFGLVGVPGVLLALGILYYVREANAATLPRESKLERNSVWLLTKSWHLWLCLIGGFGLATFLFSFTIFAPLYVTEGMHKLPTTAGFLMGAVGLGGFLSGVCAPAISDHVGRKPVLLVCALTCAIVPLFFMVPILYGSPYLLALLLVACSTAPAAGSLIMVLIPTELAPAGLTGASIGFVSIGVEMLGGSLAPLAGGSLSDHFGPAAPMYLATAGACLLFLVALVLPKTSTRVLSRPKCIVSVAE